MSEGGRPFRGFVAVALSEPVRAAAEAVMDRLRGGSSSPSRHEEVRWTAPENLHLTLKFLGQVPLERQAALEAGLAAVTDVAPFTVELGGVGAFPRVDRPQVVWIGVTSGQEALAGLGSRVESICLQAGFPAEERPFRAHLTLGRTRTGAASADLRRLSERLREAGPSPLGSLSVDAVHLMESTLTPRGPIYTVLETVSLGG